MDIDKWIIVLQLLRSYYGNLNHPFFAAHDIIGIDKDISIPALARKLEELGWVYDKENRVYIYYV